MNLYSGGGYPGGYAPGFNPVNEYEKRQNEYQQRLQEAQRMLQQQSQPQNQSMMQPQQQPVQQQVQPVCMMVTNSAEAVAYMINPLYTYVFLNAAAGEIYVKEINNDGRPVMQLYRIQQAQSAQEEDPAPPVQAEPDRVTSLEAKVNDLESKIKELLTSSEAEPAKVDEEKKATSRSK